MLVTKFLLEVLHLLAKSVQIEVVSNVFLVDLHKKFVAFEVAEPGDPPGARVAVVVVVQVI